DVRVRSAAIRSLLEDFRKLADEIDPPAKKNVEPPPTEPKAKLQDLRDKLRAMENDEKALADLTRSLNDEQTGLRNMEAALRTTPTGKDADVLKAKIEYTRKVVQKMKDQRSEEHTSELQSLAYLVCR